MSEVRVVAMLTAKPEFSADIRAAVERVVEPSREETGNIRYDLHEDREHPGTYVFFEIWASDEALKYHDQTAHFRRFVQDVDGKLELLEIRKLDQIA
ncbi:putative quinol monooxygenase [Enterobacillus tribolii]|uniref:Quinol monooxygenase YgiN n=1 Tax=Enterobacillus tribolii TaxID=1487935 RepID=A0A370R310_9GAMM|nr:putative quinol monooxygenase [Enterobacillus tribolii]MBW7983884.1 antibiotic biosynthesis monooxygenase [Enterobacillus tribolii]RDK96822.1 quinol monooxygenase YgiN [Enterobacillus tribolii]